MAIAQGARQRGARMEQNCAVTALQPRTDGGWDVVTEKVASGKFNWVFLNFDTLRAL